MVESIRVAGMSRGWILLVVVMYQTPSSRTVRNAHGTHQYLIASLRKPMTPANLEVLWQDETAMRRINESIAA
jgi:hypothetical protein